MKILKIKMDDREKNLVIGAVISYLNFIFIVILPIISYFLNVSDDNVERLTPNFAIVVVLGVIITTFFVLTCSQKPFTLKRLAFSLIAEILLCFYIAALSRTNILSVSVSDSTMEIDMSKLYLIMIGIPILIMIRNTYNYVVNWRELNYKITILRAIKESNKTNTKIEINKFINKDLDLDSRIKKPLLNNFMQIFNNLLKEKRHLIKKTKRYELTERGNELLKRYEILTTKDKIKLKDLEPVMMEKAPEEFEVWTEEELENLAQKRNKKEITKKISITRKN